MKLCATIAEFNPFHNGHKHLIASFAQHYDGTVAIMSGNFVQRGAPAIFNKFARANAAVKNGVDLVIELPVIYSLSGAETFALGAIKSLNALNSIDALFFGSEEGNTESLLSVASLCVNEPDSFKSILKEKLSEGLSYPKALNEAYLSMGVKESLISSPNNILGIEYIKSLLQTQSEIKPSTISRIGVAHDSSKTSQNIASASHLRSLIKNGEETSAFMPDFAYPAPVFDKHFSHIILYALKTATLDDFQKIHDCPMELASRFLSASSASTLEELISLVKSKNFTESRIRRILWNLVIKNFISPKTDPSYIRILAQNKRGCEIISHIKKNSALPIVQKCAQIKNDPIFSLEARATDIYNIIANNPSGEDFRYSPIPI